MKHLHTYEHLQPAGDHIHTYQGFHGDSYSLASMQCSRRIVKDSIWRVSFVNTRVVGSAVIQL